MPVEFKMFFTVKVIANADESGSKTSLTMLNFAPVILISLITLKPQVRAFEKYIIAINPLRP